MKPTNLFLITLLLMVLITGCNFSNSTNEMNSEQVENHKTVSSEEGLSNHEIDQTYSNSKYINDTLSNYVSRIKNLDKEREKEYYKRSASIKDTYGDVYFFNGKVKKAVFSEPQIGINGIFICYYDGSENLVLIETNDHANTWYREEYFLFRNDTLFEDSYYGEYADSTLERVFSFNIAEKSWMNKDLFNETKRRALFLKQEAIYNQQILSGTRYYHGLIDGKYKIQMRLNQDENWGYGDYHYEKASESIDLSARIQEDSISITEKYNDSVTGIFKGMIQKDFSIRGIWMNQDNSKQFPFVLTPARDFLTKEGKYLRSINITPEDIEIYGNQVFGTD